MNLHGIKIILNHLKPLSSILNKQWENCLEWKWHFFTVEWFTQRKYNGSYHLSFVYRMNIIQIPLQFVQPNYYWYKIWYGGFFYQKLINSNYTRYINEMVFQFFISFFAMFWYITINATKLTLYTIINITMVNLLLPLFSQN